MCIMDFFGMSRNPSNGNLNKNFLFQITSFAQNIYFQTKNREKIKNPRLYSKICVIPPQNEHLFFPSAIQNQKVSHVPDVCTYYIFSWQRLGRSRESVFQAVRKSDSYLWRKIDFFAEWREIYSHKLGGVWRGLKSTWYLTFVSKRKLFLNWAKSDE